MIDYKLVLIIKITLIITLFLCLLKLPYGFYMLFRIIFTVGFMLLAMNAKENNNERENVLYFGLVILFQPFFKIPLGRFIWNIVDVIIAIGLIFSIYKQYKNESKTIN